MTTPAGSMTCLEICAGAGGLSLGLGQAGFAHTAAAGIDPGACATLRMNRPGWKAVEQDVHHFSIAGKPLGADGERDLSPPALRLVEESQPPAVLLENVRGLSGARFAGYRDQVLGRLHELGPTQAREAWLRLGVDGKGLAGAPPGPSHPLSRLPRLTLPMAAAIQGFPPSWQFSGRKTAGYRQIGNAFPPVAHAVGDSIRSAIQAARAAGTAPGRWLRAV